MKNLVEMIKNEVTLNNEFEEKMFDVLENNIDGYDDLDSIQNYMENEAICSTGSVNGLIYYSETRAVFKEYFEEILELVEEYKEEIGESINIEMNYNNLVWFAFEWLVNRWNSEIDWDNLEESDDEE